MADKIDVEELVREAGLDWHRGFVLGEEENRYAKLTRLVIKECAKVCLETPVLSAIGGHAWTTIKVQEALAEAIRARMP
jgi:hypothetical protein